MRGDPKKWGGFHGAPLITMARVRLNVHMSKGGRKAMGIAQPLTASLPVGALFSFPTAPCCTCFCWNATVGHIFLNALYRDVSVYETTVAFIEP